MENKRGFNKSHIKFIKDVEKMAYNPERKIDTFYQFCKFKNPKTNLFQIRKIYFNEKGKIIQSFEKEYDGKTIKHFIKKTPTHKYKMYPTMFISNIAKPNKNDMTQVQSLLINDQNKKEKFQWMDNGLQNNGFFGAPLS